MRRVSTGSASPCAATAGRPTSPAAPTPAPPTKGGSRCTPAAVEGRHEALVQFALAWLALPRLTLAALAVTRSDRGALAPRATHAADRRAGARGDPDLRHVDPARSHCRARGAAAREEARGLELDAECRTADCAAAAVGRGERRVAPGDRRPLGTR